MPPLAAWPRPIHDAVARRRCVSAHEHSYAPRNREAAAGTRNLKEMLMSIMAFAANDTAARAALVTAALVTSALALTGAALNGVTVVARCPRHCSRCCRCRRPRDAAELAAAAHSPTPRSTSAVPLAFAGLLSPPWAAHCRDARHAGCLPVPSMASPYRL